MNDPILSITFDGNRRHFEPGEMLVAEYRLDSLSLIDTKAIEASVVWYTVGKGDEDFGVHQFVRYAQEDSQGLFDCRRARYLKTVLPRSPLSYEGVIVKVRWCVRVRLFPTRGREMVAESSFVLGHVPPAANPVLKPAP